MCVSGNVFSSCRLGYYRLIRTKAEAGSVEESRCLQSKQMLEVTRYKHDVMYEMFKEF